MLVTAMITATFAAGYILKYFKNFAKYCSWYFYTQTKVECCKNRNNSSPTTVHSSIRFSSQKCHSLLFLTFVWSCPFYVSKKFRVENCFDEKLLVFIIHVHIMLLIFIIVLAFSEKNVVVLFAVLVVLNTPRPCSASETLLPSASVWFYHSAE